MQNNPLNSLTIKDNLKHRKDSARIKLSLLKPKKKSPQKSKKLYAASSSNDNTILNYYPKTSITINDHYSLKLESTSDDKISDTAKIITGNNTDKSQLFKPSKIRKRTESETPKNIFKKVQNSPESALERSELIKKSGGDSEQGKLKAKGSKKQNLKVYCESVFDNIDLEKYTETSKFRNFREIYPAQDKLIDKGSKKQRRKSCSQLNLDDTKMSNGPERSQLINKVPTKLRGRLYSQSIFNQTDLEEDNDAFKSIDDCKKGNNTESFTLLDQTTKKKGTQKSNLNIAKSIKKIQEHEQNSGNSFNDLNRNYDSGEKQAKQDKQNDKHSGKRKTILTINDTVMESDLTKSKLIDADDKDVTASFQPPIKQMKKRQRSESESNQIKTPKKICNKETSNSIISNSRNEKTSILIDKNGKYEEYSEQNQFNADQTQKQGNIIKYKPTLKDFIIGNKPITAKLKANNVQPPKKRGTQKLDSTKTKTPTEIVKNTIKSSESKLIGKDDTQNSVEQPNKKGRLRSDSVKDTTTKINAKNYIEEDTSTLFDKNDTQNSVEQPKKRGKRLDSIKDATPKNDIEEDTSTLFDKNDTQNSVEQPKKRGRPRSDSVKDTTPKIYAKNYIVEDTSTLFDKNDTQNSVEQPKKKGRLRSDSVKDTTPKITKNNIEPDTSTLFNKNDTQNSVEQPKKRGRPRSDSVKDTTPKITKNNIEPDTSTLFNKNDTQNSVEQPKKRGRPRSDSVKDTTPKIKAKNYIEDDTPTLFDKNNTQNSVEQPKKRGRPRSDSVKDTTPKIKAKNYIEEDTSTLVNKSGTQNSVEQPKKRGRPRSDSVKDTTPKIKAKNYIEEDTSTLVNKNDTQNSVEQPKKRGKRLDSVKDITPKIKTKKDKEPYKSTLFDKDDKQNSIEQSKLRLRPRSDSVKDTTPKTSAAIEPENDYIPPIEVELYNSDINADINSEISESINENDSTDLLQPLDGHPIQKRKGKHKGTTKPPTTKTATPRTTSKTINLAKTKLAMLKPNGKITKESLKATSFRKIPQNRFENALEMLRNEDHPVWENHNISCSIGIHRYWEPRPYIKSNRNLKIKYARQFLLRRDWINLSKALSLSTSNFSTNQNNQYYPLLTKYAALCLAHTDKEQFNKFVQFLVGMDDETSTSVMKKCTNIIKENKE